VEILNSDVEPILTTHINPKEIVFKLNQNIDDIEQIVVSVKSKKTGYNSIYYSTMKFTDLHFHGAFIAHHAMINSLGEL